MAKLNARGLSFHYQLLQARPRHDADLQIKKHIVCIVYIHGLIMDNLSSGYFTFAHRLSVDNDVLLYDLRGHGKSECPKDGYRVEDHVEDLIAILNNLEKDQPVHLIGCSFGGLIALEFARSYPSRVKSVILIDGHLYHSTFLTQLGIDLQTKGTQRETLIKHHFQHWLSRDQARKRARLIKRAEMLIYQTSLLNDLQNAVLPQTPIPTGVKIFALYGEKSDAYAENKEVLEAATNVQHKIFPKCSHALLWEVTDEVVQVLFEWVTDSHLK